MFGWVLVALASAAPLQIPFQGRLLDATGAPLSGPVALTFTLHDAETGGNLLFTESLTPV
jgi:hypothetical protein